MSRYYKCPITGAKLPSVTTITGQMDKPALVHWAANCAVDYILDNLSQDPSCPYRTEELYPIIESARKNFRKVGKKAMDIGSAVHDAIERYLIHGDEPQSPSNEVLSAFLGFLEWQDAHGFEVVATEKTVYHHDYAGTCDLICKLDGKVFMVDFKTYNEESKSKPPYEEVKYQIAAYRHAADEEIEGSGALYLGKISGKMLWIDLSDSYENDLKTFNILTQLWYSRRKRAL